LSALCCFHPFSGHGFFSFLSPSFAVPPLVPPFLLLCTVQLSGAFSGPFSVCFSAIVYRYGLYSVHVSLPRPSQSLGVFPNRRIPLETEFSQPELVTSPPVVPFFHLSPISFARFVAKSICQIRAAQFFVTHHGGLFPPWRTPTDREHDRAVSWFTTIPSGTLFSLFRVSLLLFFPPPLRMFYLFHLL